MSFSPLLLLGGTVSEVSAGANSAAQGDGSIARAIASVALRVHVLVVVGTAPCLVQEIQDGVKACVLGMLLCLPNSVVQGRVLPIL